MYLLFDKVFDLAHSVFENPNRINEKAAELRKRFLDNIDENLLIFERKFTENKGVVHWSVTYDDFIDNLLSLLKSKKIKSVNTFASSFNDELGLDDSLKSAGIATLSTDNTCSIFEPTLGIVNTGSLFSVFNSAYDMELVMGAKLKIFIIPINKFICNLADLELFSHILSIYKYGVDFPFISSVFTPDSISSEFESHVFLIDNGRSNILASKTHRKALLCIDCGACKKVCPVYNTIGDKPYNNVFTGPFANVVLPFLENFHSYKHLSFNSVLCGNCSRVCPMNIPLTDLMIENRKFFFDNKIMEFGDILLSSRLKKLLSSRKEMNKSPWRKKRKLNMFLNKSAFKTRKFPKFSEESYNVMRTKK
jgi:L-lactate dehydrogenase complex protein LldF